MQANIKSVDLGNGGALTLQFVEIGNGRVLVLELDAAGKVQRTIADCPQAYVEPALALLRATHRQSQA